MRLPLLGGSYVARSVIANVQRCINYFPEHNPKDAPVPVTYYQRPGLKPLVSPALAAPGRGIWRASNGQGFCVIGSGVYEVTSTWQLVHVGNITGGRSNPCSFVDNGTVGLLVDGSTNGYEISLGSNIFAPVVDPTGTFTGADKVDFIDTFILWNIPGTRNFGSTHSGSPLVFDPLYVAAKTDWPDPLMTLGVVRHEILLIGALKSEIWFDAGNPLFPFAELPGSYIEHGTVAKYSFGAFDISAFWLCQDLQGDTVVYRHKGYVTQLVSNNALSVALKAMKDSGADLSDAVAYTYQQDGHYFYVLSFESGDQTWVFDDSTGEWHQRAWTDTNGVLHRDRVRLAANIHGKNVGIDWENGTLYELDTGTYSDTVNGIKTPMTCVRSFPAVTHANLPGTSDTGQPTEWNGKRIRYKQFIADIEAGTGEPSLGLGPPQISLRWSDDRGKTWGNAVLQSHGSEGEFTTTPSWRGLGVSRYRIFELSHSIDGPAALNGAWIEAERERD